MSAFFVSFSGSLKTRKTLYSFVRSRSYSGHFFLCGWGKTGTEREKILTLVGWGYYSPFAVTFRRFLLAVDWLWTFNALNEMSRVLHSLPSDVRPRGGGGLLFVLLLAIKTLNLCRSNLSVLRHTRWFARVWFLFFPRTWQRFTSLCRSADTCVMEFPPEQVRILIIYICVEAFLAFLKMIWNFVRNNLFLHWNKRCAAFVLTRKTQFYRRQPMRIISFCYNYKLNDLLKETCTYSAIIEAVISI